MTREKKANDTGKPPVPPEATVTAPLPVIQRQDSPMPATPAATPDEEEANRQAYLALERHRAEIKRRKTKHWVIAGVIAAVVVLIAVTVNAIGSAASSPLLSMSTDVVSKGDFTNVVSASGALQPVSSTNVTPEVDGIIDTISVSAGDTVQAGDVLFTLKND